MSVKVLSPSSSLPLLAITNPPCSAVSAIAELLVLCSDSLMQQFDITINVRKFIGRYMEHITLPHQFWRCS